MKREFEVSVAVPRGKDVKNFTHDVYDAVIMAREIHLLYRFLEERILVAAHDAKISIKLEDGEHEGSYILITIDRGETRMLELPYPIN